MSRWLTTGQMIDELRLDEIAESNGKNPIYAKVTGTGGIYQCYKNGTPRTSFYLHARHMKMKWRILPNYVSFEGAMKAMKEGKQVSYYDGDWNKTIHPDEWLEDSVVSGYTFLQLINGKWTIEE